MEKTNVEGITVTILAKQLAEAVRKDEAPQEGGFDLSAGLFGTHVSDWIRATAGEMERMRETLQSIADADWRRWEELASPEEFVRWAKSRAAHALTPNMSL